MGSEASVCKESPRIAASRPLTRVDAADGRLWPYRNGLLVGFGDGSQFKALVALMAVIGLAGFASWLVGTPYWALYQLKRAVVGHDQALFRHYTDTEAVVHNGVDSLMDDASAMVWGEPRPDDIWRGIGRRLTDDSLDALRPQLKALAMMAVEDQLQRRWLSLTDTGRLAPHVDLVKVDWQGGVASVTIRLVG